MSTARRFVSGLLQGTGAGLVDVANKRHQETLRRLEIEYADRRDERRHEQRKGLLASVQVAEGNEVYGITQGGERKDLGFRARPTSAQIKHGIDDDGMSVEDKRLLDSLVKRHTSGKGSLEGETTDWDAISRTLQRMGRDDLLDVVGRADADASTRVDVGSPEYTEAQRMAEKWAKGKAGLLRRDKADFSQYGGSRAEAIQAKTLEYYRQLTGSDQRAGQPSPGVAATSEPASGGDKPSGAGTQTSPYRATTQQHIEWFKNNAPDGSVIHPFVDPHRGFHSGSNKYHLLAIV